jgi:hypothetical protein
MDGNEKRMKAMFAWEELKNPLYRLQPAGG